MNTVGINTRKGISSGVKIAIIDYGMGNIASVRKACIHFGASAGVVTRPKELGRVDKIILPGVGAFGDAMRQLTKMGLDSEIEEKISAGMPFLGICLGMHLLFEKSEESKGVKGLGILKGRVVKFKGMEIKVPHMGWNQIKIKYQKSNIKNAVLKGVKDNSYVYFCHSYYVAPVDKNIVAATTDYGGKFASVIAKDNIFGIQFHPEKSQRTGLKILEDFIKLC
ncbi:MAG: imidazole glycerol phosphate synthase subunit HisH [Candidatus Omnitrophota bacterium]|nr:imidazole glycerol phosphate synthase subunit HisH [Candidatus Omnitrophota bacterium]